MPKQQENVFTAYKEIGSTIPGSNPLRDITNTDFRVKTTHFLTKSPLTGITLTPRQRRLLKAPVELHVTIDGVCTEEPRFMVDETVFPIPYCPNMIKNPTISTPERRAIILHRLPLVSIAEKQLATIQVIPSRLNTFRGKRRLFPDQNQVMHYISANEYVAAIDPMLETTAHWEWLHLLAFCLGGPDATGPQHPDNLVAGTKECNQLMLRFERNITEAIRTSVLPFLNITVQAELIPIGTLYSHIANKIKYKITDTRGNVIAVNFYGTIYHGYPKDLDRYAYGIVHKILDLFSSYFPASRAARKLHF